MSETLVMEIAGQIVREQFLLNWKFWAIATALVVVAASASAFIVSYFNRRAQNLADRADLQGIIAQLRATTDAAERIRVEIQHADWMVKEWKTIRRVKLEQLFELLYESRNWLETMRSIQVFGDDNTQTPDPFPNLEIICRLYFPELLSDILAIILTAHDAKVKLAKAAIEILNASSNGQAKLQAVREFGEQWKPMYLQLSQQIAALENRAPDVIKEIVGA